MRQKLLTTAAALSLAMCLATVTLWIWSSRHFIAVDLFPDPQRWWYLQSAEGRLCLQHTQASAPFWVGRHTTFWAADLAKFFYSRGPFRWQLAGFAYGANPIPSGRPGVTLTAHLYQVPHAFPATVFAATPALWLRAALKRHTRTTRRARGLCPACGYDLRATPTHCPECGTSAPDANPAT
jgi:hypothetical protein